MVLVDTSVWVQYFRQGNDSLAALLDEVHVICHPFIIGELSCGNLKNRVEILGLLSALPQGTLADHNEVLNFIEINRLFGLGIGWIDQHLLVSSLLSRARLWTFDTSLQRVASRLGISL